MFVILQIFFATRAVLEIGAYINNNLHLVLKYARIMHAHLLRKVNVRFTESISSPTLSDKCVGSFTSPANHITLKMQETGPTVYSPYPRRPERLTIRRWHYKGSTFSSVI